LTADELKAARQALGWSLADMASGLCLADPARNGADKIRKMEKGAAISGPIAIAVRCLRDHGGVC